MQTDFARIYPMQDFDGSELFEEILFHRVCIYSSFTGKQIIKCIFPTVLPE